MVLIEKNIPIPYGPNYGLTAALKKLEVGDSMFWKVNKTNGVHGSARQVKIKVIAKKCEGGIRIWRTS